MADNKTGHFNVKWLFVILISSGITTLYLLVLMIINPSILREGILKATFALNLLHHACLVFSCLLIKNSHLKILGYGGFICSLLGLAMWVYFIWFNKASIDLLSNTFRLEDQIWSLLFFGSLTLSGLAIHFSCYTILLSRFCNTTLMFFISLTILMITGFISLLPLGILADLVKLENLTGPLSVIEIIDLSYLGIFAIIAVIVTWSIAYGMTYKANQAINN
ncbi:MAG: hypothetical protein JNK86_01880 [Alphaproteobacteria bacterium]|nr:hypothetical protein [Alphaproteobacteria bacterium]